MSQTSSRVICSRYTRFLTILFLFYFFYFSIKSGWTLWKDIVQEYVELVYLCPQKGTGRYLLIFIFTFFFLFFFIILLFFFKFCISYTTLLCVLLDSEIVSDFLFFLLFFLCIFPFDGLWSGEVTVSNPDATIYMYSDIGDLESIFFVWVSGFHAMLVKWAVFPLMNLGFVVCSTLNPCSI